mmetsp:Transcript_26047/g.78271  ORF Transcript_26047/g.78271 Transcript_26047/m.78271 type:complete len:113 (+) Transcript_26047:191-529(+)
MRDRNRAHHVRATGDVRLVGHPLGGIVLLCAAVSIATVCLLAPGCNASGNVMIDDGRQLKLARVRTGAYYCKYQGYLANMECGDFGQLSRRDGFREVCGETAPAENTNALHR